MKTRITVLALLVCACSGKKGSEATKAQVELPPPPIAPEPPPPNKSPLTLGEYPTTDGAIAVGNLEAQVSGLEKVVARNPKAGAEAAVTLVAAYLSRAQYLGKLADYDRAEEIANRLVKESPKNANLLLVRAAVRG